MNDVDLKSLSNELFNNLPIGMKFLYLPTSKWYVKASQDAAWLNGNASEIILMSAQEIVYIKRKDSAWHHIQGL